MIMDLAVQMGGQEPTRNFSTVELLDEFQTAKRKSGRSERYLRQVRVSIRALCPEETPLRDLSHQFIEKALAGLSVGPRTARGYFLDLRTVLNFAVRRGLIARNPAALLDVPSAPPTPPRIHSPEETAAALNSALALHPQFCRRLAIRYFCGLRAAEAFRLDESEIRLDERLIEVPATKSKTRRRRIVEMPTNLLAWLEATESGQVGRTSGLAARVACNAGIQWPQNVTRHSWCSYHLALHQNAARTALEAGHTENVLFANYREVVCKSAAVEFFKIMPQ
jgi:integrase